MRLFQISCHLGKMYSEMIFVNGFVHCDPHPGNVLVRKHPDTGKAEIILLDHGLYQVRKLFVLSPRVWFVLESECTEIPIVTEMTGGKLRQQEEALPPC